MYFDHNRSQKRDICIFENLSEVKSHLTERDRVPINFLNSHTSFDFISSSSSFYGRSFDSGVEVVNAINSRWSHGLACLDDMMKKLSHVILPKPRSIKRKPKWSEFDGDDIDIDRLRSGQEYWRTTSKRRLVSPPRVVVACNLSASGMFDPDTILWRGAGMLSLATILEDAGYRVELWSTRCSDGTEDRGAGSFTAIRVKDFRSPADEISIINATSGWFFRTVMFDIHHPDRFYNQNTVAGSPVKIGENIKYLSPKVENRVIIENVFSQNEAIRLIETAVSAIDASMEGRPGEILI